MLREPTIAPVGESTVVGGPTRVEPVEVDPDVRSGLVDERDVVPEVPALGPGAPLPEPPAPPRLRLGPPPATDRLRGWIVTLTLTLIAGVVRFVGLDRPTDGGTPVFDEKHYVPQAWQMLRNGGVEDNPGYELVVHPPLGKQLIAIGEWLLGYNGWGWRAAAALAGTITVLLVIRVARRLTRSTLLGGGRRSAADLRRTLARPVADGHARRLRRRCSSSPPSPPCSATATTSARAWPSCWPKAGSTTPPTAPGSACAGGASPTGVLLGLGCAVKWSGVYWLAAFAVLTLVFDLTARRAAGVRRPWFGTIVRDLAPAVWVLALLPVLVYLGGWWAWFRSETGIDRNVVGLDRGANGVGPDGPWAFVPRRAAVAVVLQRARPRLPRRAHDAVQRPAPLESKPWTWPMGLPPMLYYYASGARSRAAAPVTASAPSC